MLHLVCRQSNPGRFRGTVQSTIAWRTLIACCKMKTVAHALQQGEVVPAHATSAQRATSVVRVLTMRTLMYPVTTTVTATTDMPPMAMMVAVVLTPAPPALPPAAEAVAGSRVTQA